MQTALFRCLRKHARDHALVLSLSFSDGKLDTYLEDSPLRVSASGEHRAKVVPVTLEAGFTG